ncbi:eukaryotic-like serine/threonine-protein kinase [Anaerolineales bacterium]|nr:eukaryotic-like serine/threonine-protein kinase [Anaerolineales bacterium]
MSKADKIEYIGKYHVIRELGRGATATVYLAEEAGRSEPVAIKLVRFSGGADEAHWTRRLKKLFATEGAMAKKLDHPNIIRIHDTVFEEDQAYIVMEHVTGRELSNFCSFDKLLPLHRVVGIVFKCCLALDYAFKQGVIHRDIKPANILVDDEDNVKIMDFGLALNTAKKSESDSTFIMGVGSPAYMSPEQIKGYPLDQKTDLYSLGVVLFNLLTGRLPFRAANTAQLVYKIVNADPPMPSQINPNVPVSMDNIIRRALEKDLYSRYRNGAEMAQDLSAVRFQVVDDNWVALDTSRLDILKKLEFFRGFEELELWEVLRISTWREIPAEVLLMREGEEESGFGLIVEGEVEVSMEDRVINRLGAGEVVGEMAYLSQDVPKRSASIVTLTPIVYLDINNSALALATEECFQRFQKKLVATAVKRLAVADHSLASHGEQAHKPAMTDRLEIELELEPLAEPPATAKPKNNA